jgi:hypothetical protein
LDKLLIKTIMYKVHSQQLLNTNQYGFMQKKKYCVCFDVDDELSGAEFQ